ncbi:MAG: hypothetical protein GX567_16180 [Clostridia bacterium]|nr:hypothetical protein [Clostridia bacterium]
MKNTDNKFSLLIGVLIVSIVIVLLAIFLQDEIVASLDSTKGVNLSEYNLEDVDLSILQQPTESQAESEMKDQAKGEAKDQTEEQTKGEAKDQTEDQTDSEEKAPTDASTATSESQTGLVYENVKIQIVEQLIMPEKSETGNGRFLIMVLADPNEFFVVGGMYEMSASPELFEQLPLGTKHYLDIKNNEEQGSTHLELQAEKIIK